jgi:hypothetical protein
MLKRSKKNMLKMTTKSSDIVLYSMLKSTKLTSAVYKQAGHFVTRFKDSQIRTEEFKMAMPKNCLQHNAFLITIATWV